VSFNYLLSDFVLPPTSLIALTLLGITFIKVRPRLAIGLIASAQLALLALSMPAVASALARTLEPPPLEADQLKQAQAIVVLAGGRNRGALEWGGESVNNTTLERIRYAALLARSSGLPVYVTGGMPGGGRFAEGTLMAGTLTNDYRVAVKWVDNDAATTWENALAAARDLQPAGVQQIALVTTAMHMPRSRASFERVGFSVTAAPAGYRGQRPFAVYQLMPSASALRVSHEALREWVSLAYYRLRERTGRP
jgi:uncharacterized SAM-binding protein YcdF (DUF218 family)